MASRCLNIFLLIILAFIAGMWCQDNKEDIKDFVQDAWQSYRRAVSPPAEQFVRRRQKCECGTCVCEPRCGCEEKQSRAVVGQRVPLMPPADFEEGDLSHDYSQDELLKRLLEKKFDAKEVLGGLPNQ